MEAVVSPFKKWLPAGAKRAFWRSRWGYARLQRLWMRSNPYLGSAEERGRPGPPERKLGILYDFAQEHSKYITACLDLDVPYEVVDITRDDWVEEVRRSGCRAFLAWPSVASSVWRTMFEERARVLEQDLGGLLVPSYKEVWLYESKRRVRDWLRAHDIPHPRTWVFFDEHEALEFVRRAELPVVFKTDLGAASHGVMVFRSRRRLERLVRTCFGRGYRSERRDPRDRQWGHVMLQEYLPDVQEWRTVRIGDAFMCRKKERRGEFHSGSGVVRWAAPREGLLELTRYITDIGGFRSMNVDVFETGDGRLLVNEMHAVFGDIRPANRELGKEHMGRHLYDEATASWSFEPGYFYHNACANLRVEYVLRRLLEGSAAGPGRPGEEGCDG